MMEGMISPPPRMFIVGEKELKKGSSPLWQQRAGSRRQPPYVTVMRILEEAFIITFVGEETRAVARKPFSHQEEIFLILGVWWRWWWWWCASYCLHLLPCLP